MTLSLIVAVSENNVIGRDGDLPWRLSADLKRFKRTTMGHVMLMGRKTWESIGRPLPGRSSIVISRQTDYSTGFDDVAVVESLEAALKLAATSQTESDDVFVIGGAGIYELALPRADRLLLTRVHASVDGEVCFPQVDWEQWKLIEEAACPADEKNEFAHTYQVFQRVE